MPSRQAHSEVWSFWRPDPPNWSIRTMGALWWFGHFSSWFQGFFIKASPIGPWHSYSTAYSWRVSYTLCYWINLLYFLCKKGVLRWWVHRWWNRDTTNRQLCHGQPYWWLQGLSILEFHRQKMLKNLLQCCFWRVQSQSAWCIHLPLSGHFQAWDWIFYELLSIDDIFGMKVL